MRSYFASQICVQMWWPLSVHAMFVSVYHGNGGAVFSPELHPVIRQNLHRTSPLNHHYYLNFLFLDMHWPAFMIFFVTFVHVHWTDTMSEILSTSFVLYLSNQSPIFIFLILSAGWKKKVSSAVLIHLGIMSYPLIYLWLYLVSKHCSGKLLILICLKSYILI